MEIDDHATFDTIEARVRSHGVPIAEGRPRAACAAGALRRFPGPNGLNQEMYVSANKAAEPLSSRAAVSSPGSMEYHVAVVTRSLSRCAATTAACSTPG